MQDNTAAVEEEKPSSSAEKLLNHWLRFSSGLPCIYLVLIDVARNIAGLNPETTIVVVVSNARTLREWISSSLGPDAVAKHMVAVSTNLTRSLGLTQIMLLHFGIGWLAGVVFAVLLECCLYLFNMDFQLLRSTLFMVVSIIFESFLKFVAEPHQ